MKDNCLLTPTKIINKIKTRIDEIITCETVKKVETETEINIVINPLWKELYYKDADYKYPKTILRKRDAITTLIPILKKVYGGHDMEIGLTGDMDIYIDGVKDLWLVCIPDKKVGNSLKRKYNREHVYYISIDNALVIKNIAKNEKKRYLLDYAKI